MRLGKAAIGRVRRRAEGCSGVSWIFVRATNHATGYTIFVLPLVKQRVNIIAGLTHPDRHVSRRRHAAMSKFITNGVEFIPNEAVQCAHR